MIYINEWFPNPVGNDAAGEFIELYNSGSALVKLDGYALSDGAKKTFKLDGYSISPSGYLVLKHAQDKLTLKNTDGEVLLYGPGGQIVDNASFAGAAPEGKSYSRVDYSAAPITHFAFEYPTPGAANEKMDMAVSVQNYPTGVSLAPQLSPIAFIVTMFGTASFFLLFFIYVIQKNRTISQFFFGGDEEAGV
ncbi:MAG: lamin tail domain-containing protein [Alphaproteobacteria bacterium]